MNTSATNLSEPTPIPEDELAEIFPRLQIGVNQTASIYIPQIRESIKAVVPPPHSQIGVEKRSTYSFTDQKNNIIPIEEIKATICLDLTDYLHILDGIDQEDLDEASLYENSPVFKVGGYQWELRFYPNGLKNSAEGYASVELSLVGPVVPSRDDLDDEAKASLEKFTRQMKNRQRHIKNRHLKMQSKIADDSIITLVRVSIIENQNGLQLASSDEVGHVFSLSRKHLRNWRCLDFIHTAKLDLLSRYCSVEGGSFRVLCDLTISKNSPPSDFPHCFENMRKRGVCPDITFLVGGQEFPAHKVFLIAASSVFAEQFYGPSADRGLSRVELKNVDPRVFEMLLHFIYTGFSPFSDDGRGSSLKETKQLCLLAETYGLMNLKAICEEELEEKSPTSWLEPMDLRQSKKPKGV